MNDMQAMLRSMARMPLVFAALMLGACTFFTVIGDDAGNLQKLDGRWVVLRIDDADTEELDPPASITFQTQSGTVSGFDGCNDFRGSFDVSDDLLTATVAGTRKACLNDLSRGVSSLLAELFAEGAKVGLSRFMGSRVLVLANDSSQIILAPEEELE